MSQFELFKPIEPEQPEHPLAALTEKLQALAARKIYFGSSSWKYDSWQGEFYVASYKSKKDFEHSCLEEYSHVLPAVGGDFSFYNWPGHEMIALIDRQTPAGFKVGLKATEFVTLRRFPNLAKWGTKAGRDNPDFLNAALFKREFLDRVEPIKSKLAPIILEFTAFPKHAFNDWTEFASMLERFFADLRALGAEGFEFGVELRTRDYIHDEFHAALKAMNEFLPVAPILNSWTRVPPLDEQLKLAAPHDFPFIECRAVMRPGRTREEAVELFEPYDRLRERVPPARRAIRQMVAHALERGKPCYVFINNHLEGCAWRTIAEIVDELPRP